MKARASILTLVSCLTVSQACSAQPDPSAADTPSPAAAPAPVSPVRADANGGEALQAQLAAIRDRMPTEADALPIQLDGEALPHPVWQSTLMPGETLTLTADAAFGLSIDGDPARLSQSSQSFTAPETPGVHEIRAFDREGRHALITVFVLKPVEGQEVLEGYRIGAYPQNAPQGLIRLTEDDLDAPVSPNFTIGQFLCKQQPGHWPKFVMVSPNLLSRLEALLNELQETGRSDADSFFVMSGYRTPFYNTAIGSARLSRHMYGDAADIYPDVEGDDGVMDDLNDDGRVSRADATFLYDFADQLFRARDDLSPGGIGAYGANAVHGPFVHVDGRGSLARWGRSES